MLQTRYPKTRMYDPKYPEESIDPHKHQFNILHVCFPETPKFKEYVLNAIVRFRAKIVIIHSSVSPGTSYYIQEEARQVAILYSPVRGNLKDGMMNGLKSYTKYIAYAEGHPEGALDTDPLTVEEYLLKAGFIVKWAESAETLEWAKSMDLVLYGLNIIFAQILERSTYFEGVDYDTIAEFITSSESESGGTVKRNLHHGGYIGGHCVMQAVDRVAYSLSRSDPSAKDLINAMKLSNSMRLTELSTQGVPAHHPKTN